MILQRVRDHLLVILVPIVFLAVSPWNNLDGVNPPKFLAIASLGSLVFSLSIAQLVNAWARGKRDPLQLVAVNSIILILISLLFNSYSWNERAFGLAGRSLGAITYSALFLILISASLIEVRYLKNLTWGLMVTLGFISAYYIVQILGWDIASWGESYGGLVSTLGNPNFVSAGLAVLSSPVIAVVVYKTRFRLIGRLCGVMVLILVSYLIWRTLSIQGLLIELLMFVGLLILRLNEGCKQRFNLPLKAVLVCSFGSLPVLTLAISLGLSFPSEGSSFLARKDYWRAALNLIHDNIFFGKGFDSFGDWYFLYRDQEAVSRNSGLFSNSTHNIFLELAVFGGIPLLLSYLLLQLLALRSAIKIVTSPGNLHSKVLVVSWFGFHVQSTFSPSSLALVTLGFLLTGVIYCGGLDLGSTKHRKSIQEVLTSKDKNFEVKLGLKAASSILGLVITSGGTYLGTLPIFKDAQFRDAIEQGDGQKMMEVSRQWPFNYEISRLTASTLKSNGYDDPAIQLVRELIDINPHNIQGWQMLFEYSNSPAEKSRALAKMKELDPRNPEIAKLTP